MPDIKTIIQTYHAEAHLPDEMFKAIETDEAFRISLVNYFRVHQDRIFIIALLDELIKMRKQVDGISGDSLLLACYLLGLHNEVEDWLKIWEAKTIDFDTYCYIDIQLMPFAGMEKTMAYLQTQADNPKVIAAMEYLADCSNAGDFENYEDYYSKDAMPWFV